LVTDGPNHHHRTIGRASSAGCWNRFHSDTPAGAASPAWHGAATSVAERSNIRNVFKPTILT
jgi:hypothetical protein